MNRLKSFLPHLILAMSVNLIVLLVADRFNRAMNFIDNDITKSGLFVLAILAVTQSISQIVRQYRERK